MKISELFSYLNDDRVRRIIAQVSLAGFVVFCFWWLITNTSQNLDQLNKSIGFDFLFQNADFQIAPTLGTWLFSYEVGSSTYWDIYLIGIINTLLIAMLGIFAATIIGFLIGIMRLSNNLIFRSFATVYIEVLRSIPLLLQLFFWYFTVL